jgi:hypothetical protein
LRGSRARKEADEPVDVHDRLNELTATVRSAKAMAMSASCLANRAEMLDILQRLRAELPASLGHGLDLLPVVRPLWQPVANRARPSWRVPVVSQSS